MDIAVRLALLLLFISACRHIPPTLQEDRSRTSLEREVHDAVNEFRREQRLPPLSHDPRIARIARIHSQAMARGDAPFDHGGLPDRIRRIGELFEGREVGENIARTRDKIFPAATAVAGWSVSPGHRAYMEGDFARSGVGIARDSTGEYFITQIFVSAAPAAVPGVSPRRP